MADPYVDVVAWNNAEGGTDGTTVTAANSGGASGGAMSPSIAGTSTVTFAASGAIHDALSYHLVAGAGSAAVRFLAARLGNLTRCCGTVYFKLDALPSGYTDFIGAYNSDAGGTVNKGWTIRISSAGTVRLVDGTQATVFSSAEQVTASTVYRLEWDIDHATSAYKLEWFAGDSTAPLGTYTGTAANGFLAQTSRIDFGRATSPDISMWVDSIAVDSKPTGRRILPGTTVRPIEVVDNAAPYAAVGGASVLGAVRDESDATLVHSPNSAGPAITYRLGPRSAAGIVTATVRLAASAAVTSTTLELVNLTTAAVLGTATVSVGTAAANYTVASTASVATSVDLGLRITKA